MGSSIAAALLISGHRVMAVAPTEDDYKAAHSRIQEQVSHEMKVELLNEVAGDYLSRLAISNDYQILQECRVVIECVVENKEIKARIYAKILESVAEDTIIGSNTSSIPISELQEYILRPERFMGIHWAEPAYATRFLEITCGKHTSVELAEWIAALAQKWGKEPTILRKDIRGFIANRLMYAVYREALHLKEAGIADMEEMDKAFRYDAGSWMTLMGVFRRMDYLGLDDYAETLQHIFSQLSNTNEVPAFVREMIENQASGIRSLRGFYLQ